LFVSGVKNEFIVSQIEINNRKKRRHFSYRTSKLGQARSPASSTSANPQLTKTFAKAGKF
jgi:hypothetical protein